MLGICYKLYPSHFGPFEVLRNVGPISYKLTLPPIKVYNGFYVSLLKMYILDATHIIGLGVI